MYAGGDERHSIGRKVPHELHAGSAGAEESKRRRPFTQHQLISDPQPAGGIQNLPGHIREGLRR